MSVIEYINIESLRLAAKSKLPKMIFDFLDGGADDEWTARRNTEAFNDYVITPHNLVGVGTVDTRTTLFGHDIEWPVIMSPAGATQLFCREGEVAAAQAAADMGTFYSLSTMSNMPLEQVAAASDGPKILQVYVFRDRALTEAMIDRGREAKYDALCLTIDAPIGGNRERDRKNGMGMPPRWNMKNFLQFALKPSWSLDALFNRDFKFGNFDDSLSDLKKLNQTILEFVNGQFDSSVTWQDAEKIAKKWDGPFAVKGVMSVEDAKKAVDIGATAVWVSNHGGRQIDGIPSTIECLSEIRNALGDTVEIILDSGIRRGTHIIKALAMGANACAVGRPYLYGLSAAGKAGAVHALQILKSELERDMALLGCPTIKDIHAGLIRNINAPNKSTGEDNVSS